MPKFINTFVKIRIHCQPRLQTIVYVHLSKLGKCLLYTVKTRMKESEFLKLAQTGSYKNGA